jgi:hypothetical protein
LVRVERLKDNIAEQERNKQQISYQEYQKGGKSVVTHPTNTGSTRKRHGEAPKKHYLKSRVDLMNAAYPGKMPARKIVARKARASTKNPLPKVKPATKNKLAMKNKHVIKKPVPKKTPVTKKSVAVKEPVAKKPAPKAKRATKQPAAKTKNGAVSSTKKLAKASRSMAKEVVDDDAVDTPTLPKQVVARSPQPGATICHHRSLRHCHLGRHCRWFVVSKLGRVGCWFINASPWWHDTDPSPLSWIRIDV